MKVLESLEPKKVMHFFEILCSIPHGSGNMKMISDYYVNFAKDRGLFVIQDKDNNIIIRKNAAPGYENVPGIIIQGHLDMVCEKIPESKIDFMKDGLELRTDGTKIWAEGTTLGGDDAIAGAYALAILDSDDISHPMLEVVMTSDEEIGMLGADTIDFSALKGRSLLNLDSEDEGVFLTSCAGGAELKCTFPLSYEEKYGTICDLTIDGLKGGHSGVEIDKGRANSNVIAGRVLDELSEKVNCDIISIDAGKQSNVITSMTNCAVMIPSDKKDATLKILSELQSVIRNEFIGRDDNITFTLTELNQTSKKVMSKKTKETIISALMNLPNGIQSMSSDVDGLVETSLNMGIITTDIVSEKLKINFAVRSSIESSRDFLIRRVTVLARQMGAESEVSSPYSGWSYKHNSRLREICIKSYKKVYKTEPVCRGIHAGVECGIFIGKIPDMDCISMGPDIKNVHSVEETLDVASVERTWKLLLEILAYN